MSKHLKNLLISANRANNEIHSIACALLAQKMSQKERYELHRKLMLVGAGLSGAIARAEILCK